MSPDKLTKIKAFQSQVKAMTDEQREAMVTKYCAIITVDAHALSLKNTCLVLFQNPKATVVGGFKQWLKAGRCVNKGEHALNICFPCATKKENEEGEEEEGMYFRFGNVFDISQTSEITKED